jgi:hypothetical protein
MLSVFVLDNVSSYRVIILLIPHFVYGKFSVLNRGQTPICNGYLPKIKANANLFCINSKINSFTNSIFLSNRYSHI